MTARQRERRTAEGRAREEAIERIKQAAMRAAQAILDTMGEPGILDVKRTAHGVRVIYHAALYTGYGACGVWIQGAEGISPERLLKLAGEVAIWTAEIVREYTAIEAGQIAEHEALVAAFDLVQP